MCGPNDLNPYYQVTAATGLGAAEIVAGLVCAGGGVWGYFLWASYFWIFFPVWCGGLAIIAGAVTAASASKPAQRMIRASLGLSVVSVVAAAADIALAVIALLSLRDALTNTAFCDDQTLGGFNFTNCSAGELCTRWISGYRCTDQGDVDTGYIVCLICLILGAIIFAVALAAAIICCKCCMKTPANKVFPFSTAPIRRLSDASGNHSTHSYQPRLMVSKTIQADFRPRTIRARSAGQQTDHEYVSPKQIQPTMMTQTQTLADPPTQTRTGQQMPQIYILPVGGGTQAVQGYPPTNNPYYYPDQYPNQVRRPGPNPNWDWVRPETPRGQTKPPEPIRIVPQKTEPSQKALTDSDSKGKPPTQKQNDSHTAELRPNIPRTTELRYVVEELANEWLKKAHDPRSSPRR